MYDSCSGSWADSSSDCTNLVCNNAAFNRYVSSYNNMCSGLSSTLCEHFCLGNGP
jgi:hypothetical protein